MATLIDDEASAIGRKVDSGSPKVPQRFSLGLESPGIPKDDGSFRRGDDSFGSDEEWLAGYRAAFGVAGGFEIVLVFLALPFLRVGRK